MTFKDIYGHEVLQSRRDRSRRALFWSRIVGIVLMLTVGVVLRSEPDLRQALMTAGMNGVARFADQESATTAATPTQVDHVPSVRQAGKPQDRLRVNRLMPETQTDEPSHETQTSANNLGTRVSARRPGN